MAGDSNHLLSLGHRERLRDRFRRAGPASLADHVEQRVKDAQSRVNHLTQSILVKAFCGELTADWHVANPGLGD